MSLNIGNLATPTAGVADNYGVPAGAINGGILGSLTGYQKPPGNAAFVQHPPLALGPMVIIGLGAILVWRHWK